MIRGLEMDLVGLGLSSVLFVLVEDDDEDDDDDVGDDDNSRLCF